MQSMTRAPSLIDAGGVDSAPKRALVPADVGVLLYMPTTPEEFKAFFYFKPGMLDGNDSVDADATRLDRAAPAPNAEPAASVGRLTATMGAPLDARCALSGSGRSRCSAIRRATQLTLVATARLERDILLCLLEAATDTLLYASNALALRVGEERTSTA